MLVLLLTGFLAIILMRVLKNDFSRYAQAADLEEEEEEETGWKLVHGDVFRLPPALPVFCAYIGTGAQLFSLIVFLLLLAVRARPPAPRPRHARAAPPRRAAPRRAAPLRRPARWRISAPL